MKQLLDDIKIVKTNRHRNINIKININGQLQIGCPKQTPNWLLEHFLQQNQIGIQCLLNNYKKQINYQDGDLIGKNHKLQIKVDPKISKSSIQIKPNFLIVTVNQISTFRTDKVQNQLKPFIKKILRQDAKMFLPNRLKYLANQHHFQYQKLRLSHSATRWGSCSSNGTISLNIALMKLPNYLIDYVIIHELCHTRHMNHSQAFWSEVCQILANGKLSEKELKNYSPQI